MYSPRRSGELRPESVEDRVCRCHGYCHIKPTPHNSSVPACAAGPISRPGGAAQPRQWRLGSLADNSFTVFSGEAHAPGVN